MITAAPTSQNLEKKSWCAYLCSLCHIRNYGNVTHINLLFLFDHWLPILLSLGWLQGRLTKTQMLGIRSPRLHCMRWGPVILWKQLIFLSSSMSSGLKEEFQQVYLCLKERVSSKWSLFHISILLQFCLGWLFHWYDLFLNLRTQTWRQSTVVIMWNFDGKTV